MSEHYRLCGKRPDTNPEQQHNQPKIIVPLSHRANITTPELLHLVSVNTEMYEALKTAETCEAALMQFLQWADFWSVAPQSLIDALKNAQGARNKALAKAEGRSL